jgi:ADP-ribose pyrophosphatase YjhB (NUDIX family)
VSENRWLDWVRRLQAVSQSGLAYATHPFDRERFEAVREVAAQMAAVPDGDPEELLARFSAEAGHATPKVDVRGVAFRDGRLLLARGVDDGLWTLPGGWAEVGEPPHAAVEKEVLEETGFRARAVKLIGLYNRDIRRRPRLPFHGYSIHFLCELLDEAPTELDRVETDEIGFYAETELPELSRRVTTERLAHAFAHLREPARPADFD